MVASFKSHLHINLREEPLPYRVATSALAPPQTSCVCPLDTEFLLAVSHGVPKHMNCVLNVSASETLGDGGGSAGGHAATR